MQAEALQARSGAGGVRVEAGKLANSCAVGMHLRDWCAQQAGFSAVGFDIGGEQYQQYQQEYSLNTLIIKLYCITPKRKPQAIRRVTKAQHFDFKRN